MKKIFTALLCIFISASLFGQASSVALFSNDEEYHIVLSQGTDYYYVHEIQKGQSLYALSRTFHVPLDIIYQLNNLEKEATISIGQQIKVPVKDEYLYKGIDLTGLKHGDFIPVYYETKAKDNLYRISRVYFNQPLEDLVQRNELKNNNLSLGQRLLVGWLPIKGSGSVAQKQGLQFEDEFEEELDKAIEEVETNGIDRIDDPEIIDTPDVSNNELLSDSAAQLIEYPEGFNVVLLGDVKYSENMKHVSHSEVAHWDKAMPDNGTVYVLHQDAVIDSYIILFNPLLRRTVQAKVIGRIPYGAYTKDVRLVLSPRTAKQLGALDRRFKVEVSALVYEEEE